MAGKYLIDFSQSSLSRNCTTIRPRAFSVFSARCPAWADSCISARWPRDVSVIFPVFYSRHGTFDNELTRRSDVLFHAIATET